MIKLLLSCVAAVLGAVVVLGATQPTPPAAPAKKPPQFRPFSEFSPEGRGRLGIRVDGWRVKKPPPDAFPASFWANARCSATLVGEEVLVSAAHCFNDPEVAIELNFAPYQGLCDKASDIIAGVTADLAICRLERAVRARWFETVSLDTKAIGKGDVMILTGFGGNPSHAFGTYLIGATEVVLNNAGVVTTRDGAWTREGDSGGAGFAPTGRKRRLVAVNSSVQTDLRTSHAALLGASSNVIARWQAKQRQAGHRVLICGIDKSARNCHR